MAKIYKVRVTCRVSRAVRRGLEQAARSHRRPLQWVIEQALIEYLQERPALAQSDEPDPLQDQP
jgi:predicted transcriptional regulator